MNILPNGAPVPPVDLIDQDGKHITLETFRGSAVAVTFTYIGCPMPDQCPLVDKRFAETQARIAADGNRLRVRLLTVTIDPARDTASALEDYAERLRADPRIWTLATGELAVIDEWASRFGVSVSRAANNPSDITHNLRTAIIDRQGNLVQTYSGTGWTPEQLLADIKVMVGVD
jgi:protein SCO1/2